MDVSWEKPVLQYIDEGKANQIPRSNNIVEITQTSGWVFVVIDNISGLVSFARNTLYACAYI